MCDLFLHLKKSSKRFPLMMCCSINMMSINIKPISMSTFFILDQFFPERARSRRSLISCMFNSQFKKKIKNIYISTILKVIVDKFKTNRPNKELICPEVLICNRTVDLRLQLKLPSYSAALNCKSRNPFMTFTFLVVYLSVIMSSKSTAQIK